MFIRTVHRADAAIDAADDRIVVVTCSTDTMGRDGLTIPSSAWDLTAYAANPVWLWQHNPDWPIARAVQIGTEGNKLVARVQFPPPGVSQRSDEILGLIRAGVISAASTGFDALESEPVDQQRPQDGVRITRAELQEVSFVSVPAVPDALVNQRAREEIRRMAFRRSAGDWRCGADRELPLDEKTAWDGENAAERMFDAAGFNGDSPDTEKAKRGFLVYDAANPKEKGSYKLPFGDIVEGELRAIRGGLDAAAQRLDATEIPDDERKRAQGVIDDYKAKETPDRAGPAAIKRAVIKRGLYEVGNLAWMLESLNSTKLCAEWEAEIEGDNSPIPARLGEALKQLGQILIDMTAEEVRELIGGDDVEVVAADPEEAVIVSQAASPAVARFRLGVHRARKAAAVERKRHQPRARMNMEAHRRMARLLEREIALGF